MRKLSFIALFVAFAIIQVSCMKNEDETQVAAKAETDVGSTANCNSACAGCPSAEMTSSGSVVRIKNGEKIIKPQITFVELGSVNCIPCKKMQPVMEAIKEKYGDQIEVVFYDVWIPEQRNFAEKYGIRLIPTQVFLNKEGKEIFRHEGFFPEASIDEFLKEQGLSPKEKS